MCPPPCVHLCASPYLVECTHYASESYQSESESLVNKDVEGPDLSGGSGRLSHQDLGRSPIHYRGLSPLLTFVCSSTSASYMLQPAHASCTSITCWKYFSSSIMIDGKYFTITVILVRWDYCHHDETNSRHPLALVRYHRDPSTIHPQPGTPIRYRIVGNLVRFLIWRFGGLEENRQIKFSQY